jgi:hypothetical protein
MILVWKQLLSLAAALAMGVWSMPEAELPQGNQACVPDTAHFAVSAREFIESYATDDDSLALAARQRWNLPTLTVGAATIETDSTACQLAYQALQAAWPGADVGTTGRAVVLRLAHLRAITSEPQTVGFGSRPFLITDSTFTNTVELFWP